jgi:GTP:adenosylcobinamide-phosphate guanylyltransferase
MEDLKMHVAGLDKSFNDLNEAHKETHSVVVRLLSDLPVILDKHVDRISNAIDSKLAACQKFRKEETENKFLPVPPGFWKSLTTIILWVVIGLSGILGLDSVMSVILK